MMLIATVSEFAQARGQALLGRQIGHGEQPEFRSTRQHAFAPCDYRGGQAKSLSRLKKKPKLSRKALAIAVSAPGARVSPLKSQQTIDIMISIIFTQGISDGAIRCS